ncbi:MAG: Mur ligase family protein [Silvanigrellaceae bacterium]
MLGYELNLDFMMQPGRALLLLEVQNQLKISPPEDSPLRRETPFGSKERKLVWDTRKIDRSQTADKIIFIAMKTSRHDGHSEVADLLNAGHFVIAQWDCLNPALEDQQVEPKSDWLKNLLTHPHLVCVHSSEIARNILVSSASGVDPKLWTSLAITGTNGKTSTTQLAAAMLEGMSKRSVLRLGTLGVQISNQTIENPFPTQPDFPGLLAAMRMAHEQHSCDQLVMEATSIGIAEKRLGEWTVQCAAFLNLTRDHLDYHGNMENYLQAKLDLFRRHLNSSGHVVVNCVDPSWEAVVRAAAGAQRLCLGIGRPEQRDSFLETTGPLFAGIRYLETSHQRSSVAGIAGQWTLWLDKHSSVAQCQYSAKLLGKVQHENLAAAAAMMISLGYPLNQVAGACLGIMPIPGRLELVETTSGQGRASVLIDYAHSPDALEKTLETCRELLADEGQLICVFGCGGDRDPTKRPIMGQIASRLSDRVWITSDNPRTESPQNIVDQILEGVLPEKRSRVCVQIDRAVAIKEAIRNSKGKDILLIAGKGHEDYQILGTTKYPFSDSAVARQILSEERNI